MRHLTRQNLHDWDRRLAKAWSTLLLAAFFVPLVVRIPILERTEVIWSWDRWEEMGTKDLLLSLSPYLYAVLVLLVLRSDNRKLRGLVMFSGALAVILLFYGVMSSAARGSGLEGAFGIVGGGGFALCFLLGPALIAAGNREQKRALSRGIPHIMAGFGGIAVLTGFVFPFFGEHSLIEIFRDGSAWKHAWMLLAWLVGFLCYGVCGAAGLLFGSDDLYTWISRLSRWLPISLPGVLLLFFLTVPGSSPYLLSVLIMLFKGLVPLYGLMVLLAIGLARLVEGPGIVEPEWAERFA